MSNLMPEKRFDKNGVLTTKHVRAGTKTPASRSDLPAPKAAKKPSITKARRPIYDDIKKSVGSGINTLGSWINDHQHAALLSLTDDELAEVHAVATKFNYRFASLNIYFMQLAINDGHALNAARTVTAVCDNLDDYGFRDRGHSLGSVMRGARKSGYIAADYSIPDGMFDRVRTRVLVTQAIIESCPNADQLVPKQGRYSTHLVLQEPVLEKLLDEHTDRGDEIVSFIQERKTVDVELLTEMLKNDVRSLSSGVL